MISDKTIHRTSFDKGLNLLFGVLSVFTGIAPGQEESTRNFVTDITKSIRVVPVEVSSGKQQLPLSASSPDGRLTISVNRSELHHLDNLVVKATVRGEGFLRIFSQANDETITQIFPNKFQVDNRISNTSVTIPGADSGFQFQIQPPFGAEGLLVLLSPKQLGDADNLIFKSQAIFKNFKNLQEFRTSLTKSIRVVSVPVDTISHATLVLRTSP